MPPVVFSSTSLTELDRFMAQTLCSHEQLDLLQVQICRTFMRQGTQIIGLSMRVEGPRLMRSHAIWAERENRILFYDSAGNRFAIVKLPESPELTQIAA